MEIMNTSSSNESDIGVTQVMPEANKSLLESNKINIKTSDKGDMGLGKTIKSTDMESTKTMTGLVTKS